MIKPITITLLGFVGFVFACVTLFFNECNDKSSFHEIKYSPTLIAKAILSQQKDTISIKLNKYQAEKKRIDTSKKDSIRILDSIITNYNRSLQKIECLYFTRHFDTIQKKNVESYLRSAIELDSLVKFDSLFAKKKLYGQDSLYAGDSIYKTVKLNFLFFDPQLEKDTSYAKISLPIQKFHSDVDFFTKYPGFGVWALLIIVFCCCIFMTAGVCIHLGSKLDLLTSSASCESKFHYWNSFIICFILIGVFAASCYLTFYDGATIRDLYFMGNLKGKIILVSFFGYVSATLCFAGMLSTAAFVKCFKKRKDSIPEQPAIQAAINAKITGLITQMGTENNPDKKKAIGEEINNQKNLLIISQLIINNANEDFETLVNIFRSFFYAIALLLALLTFCTGTLYSATDSLDFIKMIKDDIGFSPTRHDFVYLYAALHTVLILLFYLPTQLLIGDTKSPPPLAAAGVQPGGLLTGLKTQWSKMTEVIIAGAPLVASFVQWLLNIVFDG